MTFWGIKKLLHALNFNKALTALCSYSSLSSSFKMSGWGQKWFVRRHGELLISMNSSIASHNPSQNRVGSKNEGLGYKFSFFYHTYITNDN